MDCEYYQILPLTDHSGADYIFDGCEVSKHVMSVMLVLSTWENEC